jgi:stage III sporulation protein AD
MILKTIIIAIICIFISSTLKQINSEISNIISVCGGVLIFVLVCEEITNIIDFIFLYYENLSLRLDIIKLLLKVIGIGYIVEFTADIAEDFGNKIISSKVIFGGKVVICGMIIPLLEELFTMLFSFL